MKFLQTDTGAIINLSLVQSIDLEFTQGFTDAATGNVIPNAWNLVAYFAPNGYGENKKRIEIYPTLGSGTTALHSLLSLLNGIEAIK